MRVENLVETGRIRAKNLVETGKMGAKNLVEIDFGLKFASKSENYGWR